LEACLTVTVTPLPAAGVVVAGVVVAAVLAVFSLSEGYAEAAEVELEDFELPQPAAIRAVMPSTAIRPVVRVFMSAPTVVDVVQRPVRPKVGVSR
jgi:hypothetical protein